MQMYPPDFWHVKDFTCIGGTHTYASTYVRLQKSIDLVALVSMRLIMQHVQDQENIGCMKMKATVK